MDNVLTKPGPFTDPDVFNLALSDGHNFEYSDQKVL
jgi:hypothetical protein